MAESHSRLPPSEPHPGSLLLEVNRKENRECWGPSPALPVSPCPLQLRSSGQWLRPMQPLVSTGMQSVPESFMDGHCGTGLSRLCVVARTWPEEPASTRTTCSAHSCIQNLQAFQLEVSVFKQQNFYLRIRSKCLRKWNPFFFFFNSFE